MDEDDIADVIDCKTLGMLSPILILVSEWGFLPRAHH